MNPADPKSDRLLLEVQGGGWSVTDWSPDDRQLIAQETSSVNQSSLWLVDVGEREEDRAESGRCAATPWSTRDAQFSRDGRGVYLTTDQGIGVPAAGLHRPGDSRGSPRSPSESTGMSTEFALSLGRAHDRLRRQRGRDLEALPARHQHQARAGPCPACRPACSAGSSGTARGGRLGFTFSTARSPGDVYSLDPATGKLTRWTESETGGLDARRCPSPTLIRWTSFDGREISGFFYRPPARFTGKRPVMINIHGGPEGQARPGFHGPSNYLLNELGVAII